MKILIIATIYPRNDVKKVTAATKVIHYFAEQWQKMGHEIYVVHTAGHTFKLLHMLPQKIKDAIKTRTGTEITDVNITKKCEYEFENIPVFRRPVFKGFSHSIPSDKQIKNICKDIKEVLDKSEFEPDLIISHWTSPTIQILSELNGYYKCKKSIVFHEKYYLPAMKSELKEKLQDIDAFGCRSITLAKDIASELGMKKIPFVCASGVPDSYLQQLSLDLSKFDKPITNFIYVGELISRKNCSTIIKALAEVGKEDWHFDVVGNGGDLEMLTNLVKTLKIENNVTFHGRVSRDQVIELMKNAQCFIMPSRGEAFGLVYLEAMATSCVTIGSKKEGIDGIVVDKKNGFLVEAGSVDELKTTICDMYSMDMEQIKNIAKKGYETANNYSDSLVARRYLEDVLNW